MTLLEYLEVKMKEYFIMICLSLLFVAGSVHSDDFGSCSLTCEEMAKNACVGSDVAYYVCVLFHDGVCDKKIFT